MQFKRAATYRRHVSGEDYTLPGWPAVIRLTTTIRYSSQLRTRRGRWSIPTDLAAAANVQRLARWQFLQFKSRDREREQVAAPSKISARRIAQRSSGPAEYQKRRDDIIKAAAEIFRAKGYEATSILDIARATNVDRATLYYYSASKAELFQEIVKAASEQNVRLAEQIVASDLPPLEKLKQFILKVVLSFKEHYPYMQTYWQEDMSKIKTSDSKWATEMTHLARRFDQALISIIKHGQEEGGLRPVAEPRLVAYGVIGLINSTHRWYRPGSGYTAEQIAEAFSDMVVAGLAAERPG